MTPGQKQLLRDMGDMGQPMLLQKGEKGLARQLSIAGFLSIGKGEWVTLTEKGEQWVAADSEGK